jgi:hypothetical protein
MEGKNNEFLNNFKAWLFPLLIGILGTMIWSEITEVRKDVKLLLAQSNIDKTRIDNLERQVRQLEQVIYNKRASGVTSYMPLFMQLYFKPEEEFDVKKYLV